MSGDKKLRILVVDDEKVIRDFLGGFCLCLTRRFLRPKTVTRQ